MTTGDDIEILKKCICDQLTSRVRADVKEERRQ